MLGGLRVYQGGHAVRIQTEKSRELLCYLALFRAHGHSRENLAELLWPGASTSSAKKYLRQALWRLHKALRGRPGGMGADLLVIEEDRVSLRPDADLWVDAVVFENAYRSIETVQAHALKPQDALSLERVVAMYRGDLLDGWYYDWCLDERERFQTMYVAMLDKLMSSYENRLEFEASLAHGNRILRCDRARESTHQTIMRLYYWLGDRTGALRQYEKCVAALKEELGVVPSQVTTELYEQIRSDQVDPARWYRPETITSLTVGLKHLPTILDDLRHLQVQLAQIHRELRRANTSSSE